MPSALEECGVQWCFNPAPGGPENPVETPQGSSGRVGVSLVGMPEGWTFAFSYIILGPSAFLHFAHWTSFFIRFHPNKRLH